MDWLWLTFLLLISSLVDILCFCKPSRARKKKISRAGKKFREPKKIICEPEKYFRLGFDLGLKSRPAFNFFRSRAGTKIILPALINDTCMVLGDVLAARLEINGMGIVAVVGRKWVINFFETAKIITSPFRDFASRRINFRQADKKIL